MSAFAFIKHTLVKSLKKAGCKLLPNQCLLCGYPTKERFVCLSCHKELPIVPQSCYQCGRFLDLGTKIALIRCGNCLKNPPYFDRTYSLFPYETPIIQLVSQLKFEAKLSYAHFLGHYMSQKISIWYLEKPIPNCIIPMPLHKKRLQERGFNQSVEIARPVVKMFKIPIDTHSIRRIRHTHQQSRLSLKARKTNVIRAFRSHKRFDGLSVAILDDVVTTGNTVNEMSKMIKKAGAKEIHIWCCARKG